MIREQKGGKLGAPFKASEIKKLIPAKSSKFEEAIYSSAIQEPSLATLNYALQTLAIKQGLNEKTKPLFHGFFGIGIDLTSLDHAGNMKPSKDSPLTRTALHYEFFRLIDFYGLKLAFELYKKS